MAGNNRYVRKAILTLLWESDVALTKEEILERINANKGRFLITSQPTSQTLGSLLAKSTQIVRADDVKVFAGDGRNRKMPTFTINRSLIKTEDELEMTTPYQLLHKDRKHLASVCHSCARRRILSSETLCLECHRATQE